MLPIKQILSSILEQRYLQIKLNWCTVKKMDYFLPISVIKIFSVWLPYHKPLFFAPYNKLCIFILSLSIGLHRQVGEEIENDFLATKLVNFLYKNATKRDL